MIRGDHRLILASASRSRADILRQAHIPHTIKPAHLDESGIKAHCRDQGRSALETAVALAEAKARAIAVDDPDAWVIGADQMLECGDHWLDKPDSPAEARDHLRLLRGRSHALQTAVCVMRGDRVIWHMGATVTLTMRDFSDNFLDGYLDLVGDDVTTTVGCYRLEGLGSQLFSAIDGDYFTILGLPLLPLQSALRDLEVLEA
ncbi:nucleoside triphosphate pyrophosphatase [Magnetospira sp. QH-2]|uniref:Maf family protein n=1 Tax=Magnetospira sp. (strain QH-2) TaxID=1288970 RepID=UPI0003E81746|nr:nucleoside triphosphate pyrophosphatase [Magnetospira sp. QH-2]CCQ75623.1 putative maf-like protein [Magnetospira sp. QH-2]